MSPFSRQSGHIRKKIFVMSHVNIIIGHFYHLYVYMSHLAVSEGLFCHRFVYMSHVAATAGHFFTLLSICPTFLIHWDIFRPLSFICPVWFFQQVFYAEQKCFAGEICISVCFNNQKSGKYTSQCITASVVFCFSASSAICFPVASI